MKDFLVDIVEHTQPLSLNLVKITGTKDSTVLEANSEDKKTLVLRATFNNVHADFAGVFGMPNLNKLKTILDIPEYRDDAKLSITTKNENNVVKPAGIHFENKNGDFQNDYRFMSENLVNEMIKSAKFIGNEPTWHITFEPTTANINRMKFQAQANSEEANFVAKTSGTDLKFYFGDASSHAGNFVFQGNVNGKLANNWRWPVMVFLGILGLQGDKVVQFCDDGMCKITVNSGLITYEYMLPAHTK